MLAVSIAWAGCLGTEGERMEQAEELEACRGDASDAEVLENIRITEEYALGLAADLEWSWTPVLFALDFLILWAQTVHGVLGASPVGWSYDDGVYRYGSPNAAIEMTAYTSEGGIQLTDNILVLESYLVGAVITVDSETDVVTIDYEQPGPLVELLGFGPTPPDPIVLDPAERDAVVDRLAAAIALEPEYIAYGYTRTTLIDYHVAAPRETIAELGLEDFVLDLEIVAVNASRDPVDQGEQRLLTEEWEVYRRGNEVGGYTTFTVDGGYFPYRGRVEFDDVGVLVLPERSLSCR